MTPIKKTEAEKETWSAGVNHGIDLALKKVEEWFSNVSTDDLRSVEFPQTKELKA